MSGNGRPWPAHCGISVALGVIPMVIAVPHGAIGQCESQKLYPNRTGNNLQFGYRVAVSDGVLLVGARGELQGIGAAYVYERGFSGWTLAQKLEPDDAPALFGHAVAVEGSTLFVTADKDSELATWAGAAYVYGYDATEGAWTFRQKLTATDGDEYDLFGYAVALDGETAIISASQDDQDGAYSGSVYVFDRDSGGLWTQTAKLTPNDGEPGNEFGRDIALHGNVLVVGAPVDDDQGTASGSAYILEGDDSGGWSETAKLLASDGGSFQGFGGWVANGTGGVLVAAPDAHGNQDHTGAVYAFEKNAEGDWVEAQKLIAQDGHTSDFFGWGLALHGDTALIGAAGDNQFGDDNIGSVYIFQRGDDGLWTQQAKLYASDYAEDDRFGSAVALHGSTAVVGAYGDDDSGNESGAAYVFDLAGHDCNANSRCDDLDIQDGSSPDDNGNGWPDECEAGDCAADLNADGAVNLADLSGLLANFGLLPDQNPATGDVDGDGDVDLADLSALLTEYGLFCPG